MTGKQPKAKPEAGRSMQAVSIRQPLAAAVLARPGPFRHPSWRTDYRGPLLIHAAAREAGREGRRGGHAAGGSVAGQDGDAAYGALLGVVDLVGCVATGRADGDPDEVGYVWVLANPRPFARPVPHAGRKGLFGVADAVVAGALAGLASAAG